MLLSSSQPLTGARFWAPTFVVGYALFMDYLIYGTALPLLAYSPAHITGEGALGVLSGTYALGVIAATPFFGWLGGRIGCRPPMIQGAILSAVATLLFALAPNFPMLIVARLAQGAAAAATWTAGMALIAEHYARRRVTMMGYTLMGSTGGSLLGPLLGGWLLEMGGYRLPFFVLLVLIGIDLLLRSLLLPNTGRGDGAPANSTLAILRDRSVLAPALAVAVAAAGWGILEPLLPGHLGKAGRIGPAEIGLLFTVSTAVYGLSAPLVARLAAHRGAGVAAIAGLCVMAAFLPALALAGAFLPVLGVLCVISVGFGLTLNPSSAGLGDAIERRGLSCYAAVYAVYNIAYSVGMIGASSFAAAFAARMGLLHILLTMSAVLLLCVPLIATAMRSRPMPTGQCAP